MKQLSAENEKLLQAKGICMIVLFGSRVGQKFKPNSDYDLAVLTNTNKNLNDINVFMEMQSTLAELLELPLEQLDVSSLNDIDPLFLYEIFRNSSLVFGDADLYAGYQAFAYRDYIATQDLRALEKTMILKQHENLRNRLNA